MYVKPSIGLMERSTLKNERLEIFYNDPSWLLPYFQPDFYGVSARLNWDPRSDEVIDLVAASIN